MDNGEQRFYLREIHSYWTTPHIVEERITELEEANLIERCANPIPMIRLTREGARQKAASRAPENKSTLNLKRKLTQVARRARKTGGPLRHQRLA